MLKYLVVNIQQVIGVKTLKAFEYNIDDINRGALVSFEAETTFGPIREELSL